MRLQLATTALRNGTLHLSYGAFNYPFFYPRSTGTKRPVGFLTDVWKEFTPDLEYHQYPYEQSSSVCDGILLPVQEGTAITNAGAYTPNYLRSRLFRQSSAAYYTAFNFYEADRSAEQQSTELVFFTVFSIPALSLLIVAHIMGSFLHFLIESMRKINDDAGVQRHITADAVRFASQVVFALGVTLTVYYHQAGFRGNNVMYTKPVLTSFSDVVKGLHDGSRQLMTKSARTFSAVQLSALVGNRTRQSDVAEPDQTQLMQRLCDASCLLFTDNKLVAMVEPNAVYSMSLAKRPCELNKISIPQPWKYLENFDRQILQTYMMSWNHTSKRTEKAVNQVLLRLFPQRMIEGFWTNRYLASMKNKPITKVFFEEWKPMSLTRLQILFYFTLPGWVISIVVFLLEVNRRLTTSIMTRLHYPNLLDKQRKILSVICCKKTAVEPQNCIMGTE